MNLVDLLLIIVIILSAWRGWQAGFIAGAASLIVLVGSITGALIGYPVLAGWLSRFPSLGAWTNPLAFLIILLVLRLILGSLLNLAISYLPTGIFESTVNKILGIGPGIINGLIYAALISALLLTFPLPERFSTAASESYLSGTFTRPLEWFSAKMLPIFDEARLATIKNPKEAPEGEKSITLPFKVKNHKARPDLEAKMLELVNRERSANGLKPLKADTALTRVARAHSADMFERGYFSHVSPEGSLPADRVQKAGIRFLTTGENLALGPNLEYCHKGLMNSPGHRANILRSSYGRLGIGVLDGGLRGLMITQSFRN